VTRYTDRGLKSYALAERVIEMVTLPTVEERVMAVYKLLDEKYTFGSEQNAVAAERAFRLAIVDHQVEVQLRNKARRQKREREEQAKLAELGLDGVVD